MYLILYSTFGISSHFYHPPALILGPNPPTCLDSITPWPLCQEDMALTVTHLLGFRYLVSICLSLCGAHH